MPDKASLNKENVKHNESVGELNVRSVNVTGIKFRIKDRKEWK
jgi:hypothetical protein